MWYLTHRLLDAGRKPSVLNGCGYGVGRSFKVIERIQQDEVQQHVIEGHVFNLKHKVRPRIADYNNIIIYQKCLSEEFTSLEPHYSVLCLGTMKIVLFEDRVVTVH